MFTGGASNLAEGVDKTFLLVFSIALVFIIGITAFMIYTIIHFSRKKGKAPQQFSGSTTLEIVWTSVSLLIVILMFYYGLINFTPMRNVPTDAIPVTATGRMWEWEFVYGNGKKSKELVLPVNKAIKIDLRSGDVNHSLFIPAFRVKEDAIPGYNNYLWFIPTVQGEFEILCTEYCGLLHSKMLSKARVVDQEAFSAWLSELAAASEKPPQQGYQLLASTGCLACHTIDGNKLVGPTFKGLMGSERIVFENGKTIKVTADKQYIGLSVFEPDKQVVEGYTKGLMKSYKESLTEENLKTITDYLLTIGAPQK